MPLPQLPESNPPWPPHVYQAYGLVQTSYDSISRILRQEEADPTRLNYHADKLVNETLPLLEAVEADIGAQLPSEWLEACATQLGELVVGVLAARANVLGT